MEQVSNEEQMVMATLQSMETLLAEIKSNPLAYEDHLSAVEDIMSEAIQAKVAIVRAMALDSYEEANQIAMQTKLKIAGL